MTADEALNAAWPDDTPTLLDLQRAAYRAGQDYRSAVIAAEHAALDAEQKRRVWLEAERRAQRSTTTERA